MLLSKKFSESHVCNKIVTALTNLAVPLKWIRISLATFKKNLLRNYYFSSKFENSAKFCHQILSKKNHFTQNTSFAVMAVLKRLLLPSEIINGLPLDPMNPIFYDIGEFLTKRWKCTLWLCTNMSRFCINFGRMSCTNIPGRKILHSSFLLSGIDHPLKVL